MNHNNRQQGFTLIELMIVVVVIAILASLALPSYQESIAKARRADAQASLLAFAGAMERFFTEKDTYLGAAGTQATPANTGAPRIINATVPLDGGTAYYNLTISAATATTFTLRATRTGVTAGDACGDFTFTHTGVKGLLNNTRAVADCW